MTAQPTGGNAYRPALNAKLVYRLGNKAVNYAVGAAGAVMQRHIRK